MSIIRGALTVAIGVILATLRLQAAGVEGARDVGEPIGAEDRFESVGSDDRDLDELREQGEEVIALAKRLVANPRARSIPKLSGRVDEVGQQFEALANRRGRRIDLEKGTPRDKLRAVAVDSAHADFLEGVAYPYLTIAGDTERFNQIREKALDLRETAAAGIRRVLDRQIEAQESDWRDWLESAGDGWNYYGAFYDQARLSHPTWVSIIELRMDYAYQLQEMQEMGKAAEQWRAVLEWQPDRTDAWERLSYYAYHMGDVQQSFKLLKIATTLESRRPSVEQNPWIWNNFADFVLLFRNDVRALSKLEADRFGEAIPALPEVWDSPFEIDSTVERTRVFRAPLSRDVAIVEHALGLYGRAKSAALANPDYSVRIFNSQYADGLKHLYLFSRVWPSEGRPSDRRAVLTQLNRTLFQELRAALEGNEPKWQCDGVRIDLVKFLMEAERWSEAEWHLERITTAKYEGRATQYRKEMDENR